MPVSARGGLGVTLGFLCSLLGAQAHAQEPDAKAAHAQETYERQRVEALLGKERMQQDPSPEGKRIAWIRVYRNEVFEENDLIVPIVLPSWAPTWPNAFHWLTQESVVRRELLLEVGAPFRDVLAEETMRNLRSLGILALVRIAAVRTANPDEVGVVVYTRDIWTLRLETDVSGTGKAGQLTAQLIERNLFGRNKQAGVRFDIRPMSFSIGETYYDRRLFAGELQLYETLDVIFNTEAGTPEGSQGQLYLSRPFYNLAQHVAYDLDLSHAVFVNRQLRNGEYVGIDPETGMECDPQTAGCPALVWDEKRFQVLAQAHYRRGIRYRQTYTAGMGFRQRSAQPNEETGLAPEDAAAFAANVLPTERRDVFPLVRYRLSLPDFEVFQNLGSFGQSETVQVGPMLDAQMEFPAEFLGSTAGGMIVAGSGEYVWAKHDGMFDVEVGGRTRLANGRVLDQWLLTEVKGATPAFLAGRLVARLRWEGRRADSTNTQVTLGGDNGLRGYVSQAFRVVGGNLMQANLEYRSLPLVLASIHLGGVLFYDAGAVYAHTNAITGHHAVGAGVRVLLPQFNRYAFRADVGVPLDQDGFSVVVTYGSDQVIPLTPAEKLAASQDVRVR